MALKVDEDAYQGEPAIGLDSIFAELMILFAGVSKALIKIPGSFFTEAMVVFAPVRWFRFVYS